MKKILISFFILSIFLGASIKGYAQIVTNATCPVMPGERVKQKFYVDYRGDRIYLCCRNCVIAFKKNPGKYMRRIAKQDEAAS